MSEYSKFLDYFNTKKGSEGEEAEPRFIKQETAETISTAPQDESASGTAITKYTDRLEASLEEDGKEHTGYTGKIDTVSANSAAQRDPGAESDTKSIPASVFDAAFREATADGRQEEQTKHIDLPKDAVQTDDEDVSPTKPIGSGKGSLLVEIARKNAEETGEDPDQLVLEGFLNKEEAKKEEEKRAEKEMRRELNKTRQKRINDFHFWSKADAEAGKSPDGAFASGPEKNGLPEMLKKFTSRFEGIESGFLSFSCDEYKDPNDHRAIFKKLMDIRRNTLIRAAVLGLLGLVLLIINIAASVSAAKHNGFFTVMGGSAAVYVTTNLIFLALASFTVFDDIREGIVSLLQGHPKTDASLVFLLTASFVQLVACYLTKQNIESDFHLITGGVILLCVPLMLAKTFYYDNTRHCFKSIAAKSEKSYLRRLSDKGLVAAMLGGAEHGDAEVVYASKTRFIRGFIRRSRSSAAGGQISSRITLISMAASFLTGIAAMIIKSNVMWGLSVMTFAAALSLPVGCLFFTGFMIANENRSLSVKSSFVRSYSDARDLAKVENLVLRAEDIFTVEITETVCVDNINSKQAELCAAVITEKTGGLLKKAFSIPEKIRENGVPEAEQLTYEDKLGFSAWVGDCRVLLGSNAFLSNHNVRMPDESGVLNFIDTENKPVYLAIEGHFTAMFSAKYGCVSEHIKNLKTLADNGTNILIVSSDPNITDAFAEKLLGLPADSVRVISQNAAEKLAVQQNTVTDSEDTGIVFSSGSDALCRCAFSAVKLDKLKKLSKLICEIWCCTGCALALVFSLAGAGFVVSGWPALLLQLLGMALCFFIPPLLTASSLPAFSRSAVHPVPRNELFTPDNFVPRPRKIEDEEESEEPAPEETDSDMKIAPEIGEKKRVKKRKPPVWEDDEDDEEDDELFPAPRRAGKLSGLLKTRLGKPEQDTQNESDEAPPMRDPMLAKVPADPDDIHLSTEELLQSPFFREEDAPEEPGAVRAAPAAGRGPEEAAETTADRPPYAETAGDDYDNDYDADDDPFADGLLGKLLRKGKHGKRAYGDEYEDDPRDYDDGLAYEPPKRRGKKSADKLPSALKGFSAKMVSFAKGVGKKDDGYDGYDEDEGYDEPEDYDDGFSPDRRGRNESAAEKSWNEDPATSVATTVRPSILSFAQDDPAPPRYELGKTDEYDFLNVKFEPPAIKTRDYYNDAFFSRYEPASVENDADAVYAGLKEQEDPSSRT